MRTQSSLLLVFTCEYQSYQLVPGNFLLRFKRERRIIVRIGQSNLVKMSLLLAQLSVGKYVNIC